MSDRWTVILYYMCLFFNVWCAIQHCAAVCNKPFISYQNHTNLVYIMPGLQQRPLWPLTKWLMSSSYVFSSILEAFTYTSHTHDSGLIVFSFVCVIMLHTQLLRNYFELITISVSCASALVQAIYLFGNGCNVTDRDVKQRCTVV